MKPKKTNHTQSRLFEQRLSQQLDPKHPLILYGQLIDWKELEQELNEFFHDTQGAPAAPVQLICGLFMLQHMSDYSDEQVVRTWVENPYWQLFCGYDFLQWSCPIHPSSLSRWRVRLGEKGVKRILREIVRAAVDEDLIRQSELATVLVDTTVLEKNISYPTDAKLYARSADTLIRFAKKHDIGLRQTYSRLTKKKLKSCALYSRARKYKKAQREVQKIKTYFGRVLRETKRKVAEDRELHVLSSGMFDVLEKIYQQKRTDTHKIYSVHEPKVECISKGKVHKKYEFGCKVSLVASHKQGVVLSACAIHGNPYDGHTLKRALEEANEISSTKIKRALVDKGYRGHKVQDTEVYVSGTKKLTRHYRKLLNRRQAIEPIIGHMKSDGKLKRNYLKGILGDTLNSLLCGIGHNVRLFLRMIQTRTA